MCKPFNKKLHFFIESSSKISIFTWLFEFYSLLLSYTSSKNRQIFNNKHFD